MLTEKPSTINDANTNTFSSATDLDTGTSSDLFSKSDPVNRIRRVSVSEGGIEASGNSEQPAISNSGRYIAFASFANNLVAGDTNSVKDIFVYDSNKRTTKRISVGLKGSEANAGSLAPSISSNGRYVAFESLASNLVDGDTNGKKDVFVYDMATSQIRLVSKDSNGTQSNGDSSRGLISGNGRYVAFSSTASNLEGGDSDGGSADVFLHDLQTGKTTFATRGNEESAGGSFPKTISAFPTDISTDGRSVLYESDLRSPQPIVNNSLDIYDRETGTSKFVATAGRFGFNTATLSADGRYVAYVAFTIIDEGTTVSLFDQQTGTKSTVPIAPNGAKPNRGIFDLSFNNDGRYLAFSSNASNLVDGDTNNQSDAFVHDRQIGQTKRISVDAEGSQGNGRSFATSISANGPAVAFASEASNLVSGDTNNAQDIFLARNFFN